VHINLITPGIYGAIFSFIQSIVHIDTLLYIKYAMNNAKYTMRAAYCRNCIL